jgi:hypothetical protein
MESMFTQSIALSVSSCHQSNRFVVRRTHARGLRKQATAGASCAASVTALRMEFLASDSRSVKGLVKEP